MRVSAFSLVMAILLLAGLLAWTGQTSSVEIPVNATVLNSPPVLGNIRIKQPTVDPNAFFQVIVTAGDNNTLRDIRNITVDMSSASGSAMCQFVWDASGYRRLFGEGVLSTPTSQAPADRKVSTGEWSMDIKLPGHLASGRWELTATVYDEEASSTQTILFWVNSFISISISQPSSLNLTVPPGSPGQTSQTRFVLTYTSNCRVDLFAKSTVFKGVSDETFELDPTDFSVSVLGGESFPLSEQPAKVVTSLPPGANMVMPVVVAVRIPQPFYDQDYEGRLTLTMQPL